MKYRKEEFKETVYISGFCQGEYWQQFQDKKRS